MLNIGRVQSSLVLNDQMSRALGRINKAMSLVLDSFEAVQRASGRSFNTANIAAARREIGAADAAINEMEQSYRDCNNQQQQLNKSMGQGSTAAGGLLGKIKGMASAYLGMKAVKDLVGLSDTITQTDARLSMMNDGLQTTAELNDMIYASAQRSRGSYLATAEAVSKLGLMAGDAFSSNKETIAFMEQVNKQFKIAGTSAQGIDAAMLQLTQAMGSGVLRGEEYNSILEQAPNIIQSIAEYMDVPKGQLKEMAADGKITADIVKAAMFACADETNAKFESMPKTWSDIWTSMQNKAIKALDPVLAKINQLANSERVQRTVNGLLKAFSVMAVVLATVFDGVCAVYNFVADNWNWIGPIIMGIVGALLLYKTIMFIISAVEVAATIAKLAYAAVTGAQVAATTAATAAQYGLNTAILASPITWVIALVIVLIALIAIFFEQVVGAVYWLGALFKNVGLWIANVAIAIWNSIKNIGLWFANLGLAIWQVIKNIGMWFANLGSAAWAIIKNVGLWFANLGMGIWNVLKACASNVGVAFNNAWVFVQQGFWGMVNIIMQGLKSLADMANKVLGWMGVNIDTSGLDFAAKKIDELNSKKESYTSIGDAWDEGFNTFAYDNVSDAWNSPSYGSVGDAFNTHDIDFGKGWSEGMGTFETFQDGWGSDAYNAGAEVGKGLKGAVTGIFDDIIGSFSGDSSASYPGMTDQYGYGELLGQIADNTEDAAVSLCKSDEDLTYLRDLAEQEAINRFTTAEVRIDMSGMTNRIDSDMDLDGVLNTLTEGFEEAIEAAAEGVH